MAALSDSLLIFTVTGRVQLNSEFLLVISPVPFRPVLTVQSPIEQLVFLSFSVLFQIILFNAKLDRSKLDELTSIQLS